MSAHQERSSGRFVTRILAAAALAALTSPALAQVASLDLNFNGGGGGFANTGFDAAYMPNSSGFNLNFQGNGKLGILTLPGDTYGNYGGPNDPGGTDPDSAQNFFYSNFAVGDRTVLEARVNAINLNTNYHGGGIWMGTDEDHYIRLGLINNSNVVQPEGSIGAASVEALRENEDRWTQGGAFPGRPGFDIENAYLGVTDKSTATSGGAANGRDITAILRIVRDHHAVASYVSLDNGVTFTRIGGSTFSFNSLATDDSTLPIDNRPSLTTDPNSVTKNSLTVEGGFKVGAYALGGGASAAVIQFDSLTARSGTPTYTGGTTGEWTSDANWTAGLGAPTQIESTALFPTTGTARNITVASDIVVTNLRFESAAGTTVSGTGQVRFDWFFFPTHPNYYTDGPGTVTVTAGDHTISAPSVLAHLHRFDLAAGTSLSLTNLLASPDPDPTIPTDPRPNNDAGILKLGAGTLRVNRLQTNHVTVQAGTLQVLAGGTSASLSHLKTVDVTTTAGSTAKLDLTNNAVVIDYDATATSPLAATTALIKSGYGTTGNWSGPGITSSSAAADSRHAIGIVEASDLTTVPAFFGTVDSTAVLLRYAFKGDTDVNGTVNFDDLVKVAQNYGSNTTRWFTGDFNYDGVTNFDDLVPLAQNYNMSDALTADQLNSLGAGFAADWIVAQSLAPEPTSLASLLLASSLIARRRREL